MHAHSHRALTGGAAMTLAAAVVIALGVIPPVRSDTFLAATPDRAVPAFWSIAGISLLVAITVGLLSTGSATMRGFRQVVAGLVGVVPILIGLLLIDATVAYAGHGAGMRRAVAMLCLTVLLELAAGIAILIAAFAHRPSVPRPEAV